MNDEIDDDDIQVTIGLEGLPTFYVTGDNMVFGSCLKEQAEFISAILRDIADAIDAGSEGIKIKH